ncbi:hypothetical protein COX86_00100 [Candidatus Micrarchaeota archaeon CG_4_10_14_0_2_um_filter_60_11]|nr:MAG: hypothetical protein AUJ16_03750 [Candidatus Micrarchaeota archaeon CG1_02_60_51]PIN96034.1 MAG: hypothetical protein COU39_02985 [Candidatus Micrarchaeota archaeon CG10_big_fil_rev_8_21_14_0_10_60_32]PIO02397.1 MAG: hypothetical protein COT58_00445 [Candidatus Micrarchaeota archaeon CG09_land_8_20_14_0_10_60_16]PIY91995.1 MAG: hypothetical protein COY71_00195 [Candidatus Micrarchaeota archaeon CG_4_10_14_0_8_um_filter_60_7]PIZ91358.1 MAG: hypothetical protein COX86_00100 [Candidatus Mi
MKIICDSSALVSLSASCLLDSLEFLENNSKARFAITSAVEGEIVSRSERIEKYRFSSVRLKNLIRRGVLPVEEPRGLRKETQKIMQAANAAYLLRGRGLPILHEGEAECLACISLTGAKAILVDEKTTRLLLEDPRGMARTMSAEYGEKVVLNQSALAKFSAFKATTVLRSTETLKLAAELGFFKDYGYLDGDALSAGLHALRRAGCSISHRELDEYENL